MPRKPAKQSIRLVRFAQTAWHVGDIQALRPAWTDEQCAEFLREHSRPIQDAMVEAGWAAIETLLPPREDE